MNIILITGASSGLGQEFALQIDKSFFNIDEIWLLARREERLKDLAKKMYHKTRILPMDVTDQDHMRLLELLLEEEKPRLCMLINCAGYGLLGAVADLDVKEQQGMLDTNCRALTQLTRLCLPYMRKNSRIINLASSAAFVPQPGFAVYAATKSYVLSFSTALREELRPRGIWVTAVCPGPVRTEFFDIAERYGKILGIKKFIMAEAKSVVALALKDSYLKKTVSVYGLPMKAFRAVTKLLPHQMIIKITSSLK